MKVLEFDVFIGRELLNCREEKTIALVSPKFLVPCGNNTENRQAQSFFSLEAAGTYFADWFDIVDKNMLKAVIYLKKLSKKKVFRGEDIIRAIDGIDRKGLDNVVEWGDVL